MKIVDTAPSIKEVVANSDETGAEFSPCRQWRYCLWRRWATGPVAAFVGLNPSTADETKNDPTVRRCIGFAHQWGMAGMFMLNLYGWRSTSPKPLWDGTVLEPVGEGNNTKILSVAKEAAVVIACWGAFPKASERGMEVKTLLEETGSTLMALAVTATGLPRHPLYLKNGLMPRLWVPMPSPDTRLRSPQV